MKEAALVASWHVSRAASRLLPLIMGLLFGLLVLLVLTSCTAQAVKPEGADELVSKWNNVTADGTISPAERAEFAALLTSKLEGGGIDWEIVGSTAASIALSFLGVNAYRNRTSATRTAADLAKLDQNSETGNV